VKWSHQLLDFKEDESKGVTLRFQVNGEQKTVNADLVVEPMEFEVQYGG
jgi:hypothetical protein